jgi:hypothetical protein
MNFTERKGNCSKSHLFKKLGGMVEAGTSGGNFFKRLEWREANVPLLALHLYSDMRYDILILNPSAPIFLGALQLWISKPTMQWNHLGAFKT